MSFMSMPSSSSNLSFIIPSRSMCGRCFGVPRYCFLWNWLKSSFSGCTSQPAPPCESIVLAAQMSVPRMSKEPSLFPFLAGPLNWLLCPLLPERDPDPGLEPQLGLEPVLPLLLWSHSSGLDEPLPHDDDQLPSFLSLYSSVHCDALTPPSPSISPSALSPSSPCTWYSST